MRWRRRRQRGQAMTEMALLLPVMVFLLLGAADFARAFYFGIEISGASRAGMRIGLTSGTADIANAVEQEPDTAIRCSAQNWGATYVGGPANTTCEGTQAINGDCDGGGVCGDPNGCSSASFVPQQVACFAVRACKLASGNTGLMTCDAPWGTRPQIGAGTGRQVVYVVVVYRFVPATPIIGRFGASDGAFYIRQTSVGSALYCTPTSSC